MNTHGVTEDQLTNQLYKIWKKSGDTSFFGEWFNKTLENDKYFKNSK